MSHIDLLTSQTNVFAGYQQSFGNAEYVILGVPFDVTSTYRTGARFGPTAIRQASLNIETFSLRTNIDVEDLLIHDAGDLHISTDTEKTLDSLALVVSDIIETAKTPVVLGGEHTISLGILKGCGAKTSNTAVVSFDAHLDLRDEYQGLRLSHTTFMRRINEQVKPAQIIEVGTRAVCKEELAYARKAKVSFLTAAQIRKQGSGRVAANFRKMLEGYESVYVSIDMDVLDPAYVPAVQNPEADGLEPHMLIDILDAVTDKRLIGFDVLEVAPIYDQGVSAIQAAKVVFEMLCFSARARKVGNS